MPFLNFRVTWYIDIHHRRDVSPDFTSFYFTEASEYFSDIIEILIKSRVSPIMLGLTYLKTVGLVELENTTDG